MKCPDKAAWKTRVPEYLEQLISPTLLRHHQIKTQTSILNINSAPLESPYTPVLEVPVDTNGQFIRATLASYNLPSSSIKENKRVLEAFGALIGKKVVYLQGKNDVVEKKVKASPAKQTIIKIKKNKTQAVTQAPAPPN